MKIAASKFAPPFLLTLLLLTAPFVVQAQDIVSSGNTQNIVFVYQNASNKSNKAFAANAAKTNKQKASAEDNEKFDGRTTNTSATKNRKNVKAPKKAAVLTDELPSAENAVPVLTGGILNGLTTYFEMPGFSAEDLKKYRGEEIKVQVTVNAEGEVTNARAKSGPAALREAVTEKARRASFYRSRFMGDPISLTGELVYVIGDGDEYKKYDNSPNKTPLIVSGGVLNGQEISSLISGAPADVYDEVKVQVTVDEEGRVTNARAVSGNAALHKAAVESAGWWTFPRTSVLGNKVKVNGYIVINFKSSI